MIVRSANSQMCLRTTTTSRSSSAPSAVQLAAATERVGPPPILAAGTGAWVLSAVISRVVPSRSG